MGVEHLNRGYVKDYYNDKVRPKWEMIAGWARNGLTNNQIAKNLGLGESTFRRYIEEHEELAEHLRSCREDAQMIVENALFKKATGYEYEEVTKERREINGVSKLITTKRVLKHVQPDVGAAQYWLEHRASNRWPKQIAPSVNPESVNNTIIGLAQLLQNPVPVREIGSENG